MSSTSLGAPVLALVLVLLTSPVYAVSFCMEPNEPYCVDAYGTFDSDYSFNSCRREVESFTDEMYQYVNCKIKEANQAKQDGQAKIDALIEKFNCKARGETFCY